MNIPSIQRLIRLILRFFLTKRTWFFSPDNISRRAWAKQSLKHVKQPEMRASISPYDVHVYIGRYLRFYGKRLVRFDLKLSKSCFTINQKQRPGCFVLWNIRKLLVIIFNLSTGNHHSKFLLVASYFTRGGKRGLAPICSRQRDKNIGNEMNIEQTENFYFLHKRQLLSWLG